MSSSKPISGCKAEGRVLSHRHVILTNIFILTTISACTNPNNENNLVRHAVLDEILDTYQVEADELVFWLEEGEVRENFGFQDTTVYLFGPVREKEYWEVRDPARSYIFIGDIIYGEDRAQATVAVEIYLGDNKRRQFDFLLQKSEDTWQVVNITEI